MTASSLAKNGTGTGASSCTAGDKQDFLVFRLGDKEYGIKLDKVQELCGFDKVTHQRQASAPVAGQINLHGRHVLVSDMHAVLDSNAQGTDRLTDVIVLRDADRLSAVAVDCVIDVVTPGFTASAGSTASIPGTIAIGHRQIFLLDIDALLPVLQLEPGERLAA